MSRDRRRAVAWIAAVALALCCLPRSVAAHGGPPSLLDLRLSERGAELELRVPAIMLLTAVPALASLSPDAPAAEVHAARAAVAAYLDAHVGLTTGNAACTLAWGPLAAAGEGRLRLRGAARCPSPPTAPELRLRLFREQSSQHRVLVHWQASDGEARTQTVVVADGELRLRRMPTTALGVLGVFLADGVRHILGGVDHILFVLGLVLVAGALRPLLVAVSGFTVGHTATLVMAALGRLGVDPSIVEPVIAASIAYLGFEALYLRFRQRRGWIVGAAAAHLALLVLAVLGVLAFPPLALLGLGLFVVGYALWLRDLGGAPPWWHMLLFPTIFGLAHGMGFAGPLLDLELRGRPLMLAILGFNVGVELGQLLVLVATAALASAVLRLAGGQAATWRRVGADLLAATLLVLGLLWFVLRTAGAVV